MSKATATEKAEAKERLLSLVQPGSTVYTVLRHVSASGMQRRIDLYTFTVDNGQPVKMFLSGYAGKLLGYRHDYKKGGTGGKRLRYGYGIPFSGVAGLCPLWSTRRCKQGAAGVDLISFRGAPGDSVRCTIEVYQTRCQPMSDLLVEAKACLPKRSDLLTSCAALFPEYGKEAFAGCSNEELHAMAKSMTLPESFKLSTLPLTELRSMASKQFPEIKGNLWLQATKLETIAAITSGTLPAKLAIAAGGGSEAGELLKAGIEAILATVNKGQAGTVGEEQVQEIAARVFARLYCDAVPKRLEIVQPDKPAVITGDHHRILPEVMELVALRQDIWLYGPAGTGKTSIGKQIAHALGLRAVAMPCGDMMQVSDILGYKDAVGNYVPTLFRDYYENGGVYIFDEVDAGNSNTFLAKNAALDNGECAFPDKVVKRHPDFICIACANTVGNGQSMEYVGRNAIDGATKERYFFLEVPYDEDFELRLTLAAWPENPEKAKAWCKRVQAIRRAVAELKERILVTPRASIKGAIVQRAVANKDWAVLEEQLIYKGANPDTVEKIKRKAAGK